MEGWTYPLPPLLHRLVAKCLSRRVRTQEKSLGPAMVEAHHAMLPISNMVPKPHVQHHIAQVIAVKEEPKRINHPVALVHHNQHNRSIAAAPMLHVAVDGLAAVSTAQLLHGLVQARDPRADVVLPVAHVVPLAAVVVRIRHGHVRVRITRRRGITAWRRRRVRPGDVPRATQPIRPLLDVVVARQVHIPALLPSIQLVQVPQRRVLPPRLHGRVVEIGRRMHQMLGNVAGPELLPREQMHQRRILEHIPRNLGQIPIINIGPVPICHRPVIPPALIVPVDRLLIEDSARRAG